MKNNIEELIKELDIAERENKIYVIRELGNSGNKKAVKPLINLLDHSLGDYENRFLTYATIEAL